MESKKLISFLCAAAMTVSSFAGLTITASAVGGDKIADVVEMLNFDSTENFAVEMVPGEEPDASPVPKPDAKYDGVLANGTDTGSLTVAILTDGTAVKTVKDGQTAALTLVTCTRNGGDRAWYTDDAGELIKTGSYYAIEQKAEGDNYLHMSCPFFGDFAANGRWAHVDFPSTYTADAEKDYVVEFDAKFINGMIAGKDDLTEMKAEDAAIANPVLRLGTFNSTAKTANAVDIDKTALNLGDGWVHIKTVTSTKGTKVFVGDSDVAVVNTAGVTAIAGFGLYTGEGMFGGPPLDVKGDSLKADNHRKTPAVDIDNLTIYTTEPEKEANVTVTYKDGEGNELKTASTLSGIVGKQFVLPENYKASIDAEGDSYWKYASGADAFTVADGENAVNLVFTSTAKPTVTFNAVTGEDDTVIEKLGEAKTMPGTKTDVIYAHEYIQDSDGKWYKKVAVIGGPRGEYPTYDLAAVASEENSTVNVKYVPVFNVVSFTEAEETEGATDGTYSANYPKLYASGGRWMQTPTVSNYPSGFTTAAVEEEGTYEISINYYNSNGRSAQVFKLAEGADTKNAVEVGKIPGDKGLAVHTIKNVELEAGDAIWVSKNADDGSKIIEDVDYIVIKKASAVPEVEIAYANGKATLTVTNADDVYDNVKTKLIHASYTNGALSAMKVYDAFLTITADGIDAEVTIPETDTVYKGDKLMVWDSLEGMKPLGASLTVTDGEQPVVEYDVTVAAATNGDVSVDKTKAQAGDTVTITATPADTTSGNGYEVDTVKVMDGTTEVATTKTADGKYTFTMPAANVTVTVTFKEVVVTPTTYTVTVAEGITGGTVTPDKTTDLSAGDTVTLTVAPDTDYVIGEVKFNNTVITADEEGVYSFTMPAEDVTVTATFNQLPELEGTVTVTGEAKVNETLTATVEGLNDGATAKYQWMMADAADGEFTAIEDATQATRTIRQSGLNKYLKVVVTADGFAGELTSNIVGPIAAPDVEIETYAITPEADPEGSATVTTTVDGVTVTEAAEDDTVKVNATAADGYQVSEIVVKNGEDTVELSANNTFTMPAAPVTVTVKTVRVYTVTIIGTEDVKNITVKNGTAAVATGDKVPVDTVLTIEASAKDGYTITAVKAGDTALTAGEDGKYTTTVTADVTITVDTTAIPTYTINKTTPVNGSFNVSAESAYANTTINITGITPDTGYELAAVTVKDVDDADVATTANEDGTYSFTLPAKNVTVTVTFKADSYPDRIPAESEGVITLFNNGNVTTIGEDGAISTTAAVQTVKDGSKTYSTLAAGTYNISTGDLKVNHNNIYTVFDVKFADGDKIALRGQNSAGGTYFGGQVIFEAGTDDNSGKVRIQTNTSQAGDTDSVGFGDTTLQTGVWYRIEFTATYNSNASTSAFTYSIAPITFDDNSETVGNAVYTNSELTARNIAGREYAYVQAVSTGAPAVDNFYLYTDKKYDATVTVKDDSSVAVEGATVTLDKAADAQQTAADTGLASYRLVKGTYNVTVAKIGYISPASAATLVVTEDGGSVEVTLTKKIPTTLTVTAPDSKDVIAGDVNGVTYTAVVNDQEGGVMTAEEAPITWEIYDADGTNKITENVTVADGKITATNDATSGTYTVKANAGGNTTVYSDTFTVKNVTSATVTVNYVYNNSTIGTKVIDASENAAYVDTQFDLTTYDDGKWTTDPIKLPSADGSTYKVLTLDGTNTFTVTPEGAAGTELNINVKPKGVDSTYTTGKDYYYYEDFEYDESGYVAYGSGNITNKVTTSGTSNIYQFYNAGGGGRSFSFKFNDMKSISDKYIFEMDFGMDINAAPGNGSLYFYTGDAYTAFGNNNAPGADSNLLTLTNSGTTWTWGSTGTTSVGIGKITGKLSGTVSAATLGHVKIEITDVANKTAKLTVTGTDVNDTAINISDANLTVVGDSVVITGITSNTGRYNYYLLDNIEIYKPAN